MSRCARNCAGASTTASCAEEIRCTSTGRCRRRRLRARKPIIAAPSPPPRTPREKESKATRPRNYEGYAGQDEEGRGEGAYSPTPLSPPERVPGACRPVPAGDDAAQRRPRQSAAGSVCAASDAGEASPPGRARPGGAAGMAGTAGWEVSQPQPLQHSGCMARRGASLPIRGQWPASPDKDTVADGLIPSFTPQMRTSVIRTSNPANVALTVTLTGPPDRKRSRSSSARRTTVRPTAAQSYRNHPRKIHDGILNLLYPSN